LHLLNKKVVLECKFIYIYIYIYICVCVYIYIYTYTEGAKKCIHILRDVIYELLFEVELNYGSSV